MEPPPTPSSAHDALPTPQPSFTESTGGELYTKSEYDVVSKRRKRFRYAAQAMKDSKKRQLEDSKDSKWLGWLTNSEIWWRHPVCRISVTWFILCEDFYIYGEDPVNDSHVGANYPGMGNCMGLVTIWSAPSAGEALLKVVLLALAAAGAVFIGRQLIVMRLLRKRWQIQAFYGGEGCLFVIFITFGFCTLAASYVYNFIATDQLDGHSMEFLLILGAETLQYRHVAKCFQALSASVDFLTIVMITDAVLQDQIYHQFWAARLKKWYRLGFGGYARVVACWCLLIGGSGVAIGLVFGTGSGEESGIRWTDTTVGGTSELGRSFLAACIVFTDLLTVLQDWDFPMFREPLDLDVPVLIAGSTATTIRCDCIGSLLKKLPQLPEKVLAWLPSADMFALHITGKWLAYSPLLGVMGVDFMCAKTQMLYDPAYYGQYTDPDSGRVWMIVDQAVLTQAYSRGFVVDASGISWEARHNASTGALFENASTDVMLNARFVEEPGTKYLALIVSLGMLAGFCWMLWVADWQRAAQIDRIEREMIESDKAKPQGLCTIIGSNSALSIGSESPDPLAQAAALLPAPEGDERHGRLDPPAAGTNGEAVLGRLPELSVQGQGQSPPSGAQADPTPSSQSSTFHV